MRPDDAIAVALARHCPRPRSETAVPGLTLYRCLAPTVPTAGIYEPRLCAVFQGRKRVTIGSRVHEIDEEGCFVATVDLPVTAMVSAASPERPHLALTLSLDRAVIADVLLQCDPPAEGSRLPAGLMVGQRPERLLAPLLRLLALLDDPEDIHVLAPVVEREIIYRLLKSAFGDLVAGYARSGTHFDRICRATAWLRAHHAEAVSIEALAAQVGMSLTAFHRDFKTVTGLSPLQYRTEIRLREARRRLLLGDGDAGAVGFAVGYNSQSQFTRDYRRAFGLPPATDAAHLRGELGVPARVE